MSEKAAVENANTLKSLSIHFHIPSTYSRTFVRAANTRCCKEGEGISEFCKKFSLMDTHFPIRNESFCVNERADRVNHRERAPYSNKSISRNDMMMKIF